jgi:hypothetical protein
VRTLAALVTGVALLAAGCGGSGGPAASDVVKQTAANLGSIRSGTLGLKLLVTPQGKGDPFGFELHGPFTLMQGAVPKTRMAYTQIANGQSETATLVSNGSDAYVEVAGKRLPLSTSQRAALRSSLTRLQGAGTTARLAIGNWVKDAKRSDGGQVGGVDTDKVTAKVDLAEAAGSLLALARASGQQVGTLSQGDSQRLADAVRSSSFVLYSGKQDHLLRKLQLTVDIGFAVPAELKAALGELVGAKVDFELAVSNPKKR